MVNEWAEEIIFFDGDSFFASLLDAISKSSSSVYLEYYIFEADEFGSRVIEILRATVKKGVDVRIIVDGVGSSGFRTNYAQACFESDIQFKIYHELPWKGLFAKTPDSGLARFFRKLGLINKRDHRKIAIIDNQKAFVGSFNIAKYHLREFSGDMAWRDTGMMVAGKEISIFVKAFEHTWKSLGGKVVSRIRSMYRREKIHALPLIRLNITRLMRRRHYRDLLLRIRKARQRVFITTAYFIPKRSLVRALGFAARHGIDVRLLVPQVSDVAFLPWVSAAFYQQLLKRGVKVYEYIPKMMHAKTIIIDDWAIVGTTNINNRSLIHDLEVDLEVSYAQNREKLCKQFLEDCNSSRLVSFTDWEMRPFWQRAIAKFLLLFRRFL